MDASAHLPQLADPHDVVIVDGPEAEAFLQGQISQDVVSLAEGAWAWSFLLAPDGKLDALVRVHRWGPARFELVVDAGFGEPVQSRLARFKLRTDCAITLETRSSASPPVEADRIAAGVPKMGVDIDPGDLAASTGMIEAAVDFTKGCFVGQELVARMDSRGGSAPTRLVRLRGTGDLPAPGAEVVHEGTEVGALTSSASADDGWVALALVSRKLGSTRASVDGHDCAVEELA